MRHTFAALCGGCLLAAPFLLLTAALIRWMGQLPQAVLYIPAVPGWGLAAFWTARHIGLHRRHHGLLAGAACGGFYCGLRLIGAVLLSIPLHRGMLWFGAWLLVTGMLGGVIGVNTRLPARKR